jgi:tripeptide aminopeptidase
VLLAALTAAGAVHAQGLTVAATPGALLETEQKIFAAIDEAVAEENKRWNVTSLSVSNKLIGDRPGGRTPTDSMIVGAPVRSNTAFGHNTLLRGGSADANVPMSLGIPAIIIGGGGKAGGFHALNDGST